MTKVRDEVRAAFEREQAALGDVGDTRHRLVQNALASREAPGSRSLHWAAGVAAVLIAAIVLATFAIARANSHGRPVPAATPSPRAQASPTPLQLAPNVPDSTPLILYHDPASFDQLDGVTWDGTSPGKLGLGVTGGGVGDPYGRYYTTMNDIRDRSGSVVGTYLSKEQGIVWADDGTQFCDVVVSSSPSGSRVGELQVQAPGGAPTAIRMIGVFGPLGSNGGAPVVAACSPAGDRAVVYQAPGQGVGVEQFWVIQLSTGRILWQGGSGAWITVSHDARYIALSPAPGQPTIIYGPNGTKVGETTDVVFAFSWDGSLAVVAGSYGSTPSVVDWRTGQTIWTCPNAAYQYVQASAEPAGSHFAIGASLPSYANTNGFQPVDLFVVGADGTVAFEKKDVTLFQQ